MELLFLTTLLMLGLMIAAAPVRLWAGDAPGARGTTPDDTPTLTPYLVENGAGAAFVVCPGGGYGALASDHEGRAYAEWLNSHGIAAFVLHYRLGEHCYRHPTMLHDAARALRTVRARADEWRIDAGRVGIMGSSAGGHLASTLLTHFDGGQPDADDLVEQHSSRPDLGVLCYPVITLMGPHTHFGSRDHLLGENPSDALVRALSSDLQVTAQTPPCFVWHTVEDEGVPVENSLLFAAALRRHGVPFDLHIYQTGAHGLGLGDNISPFTNALPWTHDLRHWLRLQGWMQ